MRFSEFQRRRRQRVAETMWNTALSLLIGALRSGLTIPQALDLLLAEAPEPLAELLHARDQAAAGKPVEARIAAMFAGRSLALCRAALELGRENGGRTADLLEKAARTLRKEEELERKARVLSLQGRATAWIVGLMPAALLTLFTLVSPEFMAPVFQSRAGWMLLGIAAVLIAAGLLSVRKLLEAEE